MEYFPVEYSNVAEWALMTPAAVLVSTRLLLALRRKVRDQLDRGSASRDFTIALVAGALSIGLGAGVFVDRSPFRSSRTAMLCSQPGM